MRFLSDSGDGGAAAVAVEELVEDYCSDEHGQEKSLKGSIARQNRIWM